ncbi:MAG: carbohydrate porin [Verrucomicrobia bacterium]|nr:carbohydrate porin [Verrucomicrobiota bacterium]
MKFNSIILAGILSLSHSTAGEFTTYRNGQGIDLFLDYTGEVMSNVSGGDHTGTGYNGLASFGIEADLGQALGLEGVTMRLSGMDLHGSGIGSHVGDMMGASNIEGYGSARLYESWVEKSFAAGTLSLRLGLLLADEEFSTLDTTGPFLNATFGWPEFISMNTVNTGPAFYIPALGARLLWEPNETWYGQVGVYDGDSFDSPVGDDRVNRHGLHLELGNGQGTFGMAEVGYRHNQAEDADGLSGTYKLGGWWHSGEFDDFRGGASHEGIQGVYASGEQMVYREYGDQGLSLFVRAGFAPEDRSEVEHSFQVGASYVGLFPGRDIDKVALGLSHANISSELPGRTTETAVELAYEYVMSDDFTIQPSVQWIGDPGATGELDDALVLGLRVNLSF